MASRIPVWLYFGGSIFNDPSQGVSYRGTEPRPIWVHHNITRDELLAKIYEITEWDKETCNVKIQARYSVRRGDPCFFMVVPVEDDESLSAIMERTESPNATWAALELYLEQIDHPVARVVPGRSSPHIDIVQPRIVLSSSDESNVVRCSTPAAVDGPSHACDMSVPGPKDPTVLRLQSQHRSEAVWNGDAKELAFRVHDPLPMHPRIQNLLASTGLYGAGLIGHVRIDRSLLTALVERWRPETHTFHLPVGEMTVTLQDVGILLGLPIDGRAVTGSTNYDWKHLVREYLGRVPSDDAIKGSSLRLSWLKSQFYGVLTDSSSQQEVECYTRAYILTLFGGTIFPNSTGDSVPLMYLPLIADTSRVREYSWGSAALASLYRGLCRAAMRGATQMVGPMVLLQIWCWERLHVGRPNIREAPEAWTAITDIEDMKPPIGVYWSGKHTWKENPRAALTYYRNEFDLLQDDLVVWVPYTVDRLRSLPPLCTSARSLWLTRAPFINFMIVEHYFPERVLRQFGLYQDIPSTCIYDQDLHKVERRGRSHEVDWAHIHYEHVRQWDKERHNLIVRVTLPYDVSNRDIYMTWYLSITRSYISPRTQKTLGVQGSILYRDTRNPGPSTVQTRIQTDSPTWQKLVDNVWKIVHMCTQELSSDAAIDDVKALASRVLEPCRDILNEVGEGVRLEAMLEASLHATRRHDIVTPINDNRARARRPKSVQNPLTGRTQQHPTQVAHQPPTEIHREEMNGGASHVNLVEGLSDAALQPQKKKRKKNPRIQ